jgi:hypothetical protein
MSENLSMMKLQIINYVEVSSKSFLLRKGMKMIVSTVGMNRKRKFLKINLKSRKKKKKDKIWKN